MNARVLLDLLRGSLGVERALGDLLEILHAKLLLPDLYDARMPTDAHPGASLPPPSAKDGLGRFEWYQGWTQPQAAAMARLRNALDAVPNEAIPNLFEDCLELRVSSVGRQGQEYASPNWMPALQVALIDLEGAAVYDPACGLGGSLLAAARAGAGSVSGADLNSWAAEVTAMRLAVHGFAGDIRCADSFTHPVPRVDRLLMDPPLGVRPTQDQVARWNGQVPTFDGVGAWLTMAADALNDGGIAAVLVGASHLASSKVFIEMVGKGLVEAVVMLSGGAISGTSIKTCLVIIRKMVAAPEKILVVDLATYFHAHREGAILAMEGVEATQELIRGWRASQPLNAPAHLATALDRSWVVTHGFLPRFAAAPDKPVALPEPAARLLTELSVRDIKSLRGSHRVPLAPLTLVYGPNSAGKSSVLQSLLLLAQSASAGGFVANGSLADLGSFASLVSDHDERRTVGVGIQFGIIRPWPGPGGSLHPSLIRQVEVEFGTRAGSVPFAAAAAVGVSGFAPVRATRSDPSAPWDLDVGTLDGWAELLGHTELAFLDPTHRPARPGKVVPLARALTSLRRLPDLTVTAEAGGILPINVNMPATTIRSIDPKDELEARLSRALRAVDSELNRLAESIVYLGPIRPAPERFSTRTGGRIPNHAGYLYDNDSALAEVNAWLKKLDIPYSMQVLPVTLGGSNASIGDLVAVVLKDLRSGVDVSPADVGYGISQVLPIVVECLRNTERVICIEQPELHLHPRLQANLAELMVEATARNGAANQIIAETHSEHMLLRLQRLIRERVVEPDDISVIYVDQDANGRVSVQRLRFGRVGEFLDPWPAGFFDDSLDDLTAGRT